MKLDQTPTEPNGAQGLRSPDADSGKTTNRANRRRDKHGQTPRTAETQESTAPGKSTKIFSLQLTHQSNVDSRATPTGCAHAHLLASQKPHKRFYPNHPGLGGYTHRVRSRAPGKTWTTIKFLPLWGLDANIPLACLHGLRQSSPWRLGARIHSTRLHSLC